MSGRTRDPPRCEDGQPTREEPPSRAGAADHSPRRSSGSARPSATPSPTTPRPLQLHHRPELNLCHQPPRFRDTGWQARFVSATASSLPQSHSSIFPASSTGRRRSHATPPLAPPRGRDRSKEHRTHSRSAKSSVLVGERKKHRHEFFGSKILFERHDGGYPRDI